MSYKDFQQKVYSYLIKFNIEEPPMRYFCPSAILNCTPKVIHKTFGVQFKQPRGLFRINFKKAFILLPVQKA